MRMANRSRQLILAATVCVAAFVAVAQEPNDLPKVPAAVRSFLAQRGTCEQLALQRNADSSNTAHIDDELKSRKCADLPQQEQALRAQYKNDSNVLNVLDHWSIVVVRLPARIPVPVPKHGDHDD